MATAEQLTKLRLFIDDPSGNTQFLDDSVLNVFIEDNEGDLSLAASQLWKIKAARVSEWYTTNLDGSFLSRDQVFTHCMQMSQQFAAAGGMSNIQLVTSSVDFGTRTPEY